MGIFDKLRLRNKEARWLPDFLKDFRSINVYHSEDDITAQTCIDRIASAFATLSLDLYNKRDHQKIKHDILDVLDEPNLDETHFQFFYQSIQDYFSGNVYWYLYKKDGKVISIFRLNPSEVTVTREPNHNRKTYTYNGRTYKAEEILHIPSRFGYDGLKGYSVWKTYKKSFEVAEDLDTYTQRAFNNSAGKRLVVDISKVLPNATDDEKQKFRDKLIQSLTGENIGKPLVKTGGVEYDTIDTGFSDDRAVRLSDNRRYQQETIAEIFNIPLPYLTGDVANLENITTMFMTNALQPIARVFEESLRKLLPPSEREILFFEFNYASVLKTSIQAKIDAYSKQLNNAQLTINEIRRKENLPEIEAGNDLWIAANIIPVTPENRDAILANSKKALNEMTPIEDAENAGTVNGLNSART